ncbi:MAG TPA: YceI family protein [Candidatus Binatia bacterium]|nr:YceI family protein [Candidatus Binatia bacterium]
MILQLGLLLGLAFSAAAVQAGTPMRYTLDPAQSEFVVQVFKAGLGSAFAHDHVVRATAYAGQLQIDVTDPTTTVITVEVQAAALKVDEPAVRQKYGLATALNERERQETQAAMESQTQLDIVHYPTIRFRSTRIEPQAEGQYLVTGELTLRGVTQSVTFLARAELRDGAVHSWGAFSFRQSTFGYQPYSAFLGAVRNKDEVGLHFDIVAQPH